MELELCGAVKAYGGVPVLDGFSFRFPASGTVCLFGPSGCGKTTLLNCIAGLERLDSGRIEATPGARVCYLFQEDRLLPWSTAAENVAAVLRGGDRPARTREWLGLVGLGEEGGKYPSELSGGMRRRVAIARALAYGGDLYLLDEPFQRLDARSRERIAALIEERTAGKLKLLVTHDAWEAERLADLTCRLSGPPVKIVDKALKSTRNDPLPGGSLQN